MNFYYDCCAHGSVFAAAAVLGANTPLFGAIDAFGCPSKGHLLERPVTGRLIRLACGQPYAKSVGRNRQICVRGVDQFQDHSVL